MVASLLITWEKHEFRRSLSSLLITWEKLEFRRSLFNEAGAKGLKYIIWVTKKSWHEQVRSLLRYKLQLKLNSFLQFHFNWIFSISLEIYFCRCQITSSSRTNPCQPSPLPPPQQSPSPVQVVTYDKLCTMQRGTWTTNPAPEETYFSNDTLCGFYNKARI